jgi:hypothetical protein
MVLPSGGSATKPFFFEHEILLKQSRANGPCIIILVLFSLGGAEGTARMPNYSSAPICLLCQEPMQVVRTIPAVARLPEVLVFYCEGCGELETRERSRAACFR